MKIAGKQVLITGATGGLGTAIARRLRGEGAELVLSGRRADVLEPLAAELGARVIPADLTDRGAVDSILAAVGAVDILVANAGLPGTGLLDNLTVEEIQRALDVNLRAPIVMAKALTPDMVRNGEGHVVLMSSLAGKASTPGSSIYNATKFGLRGFAHALRAELHGTGVGVSVILPGPIRDAGMFAETGIKMPLGIGTRSPEAVATAVVHSVERNRAEIVVATPVVRAASAFASLAPELAARANRLVGGDKVALQFEARQAHKR
jgi:short-subunit dehydrogenase